MACILHVIPDHDDPHAIVAKVMDAVPPGSCLAISHAALDLFDQGTGNSFKSVINQNMQQQWTPRTREQVACFFTGMDLVDPGLVPVQEWRPEPGTEAEGNSALWGRGRPQAVSSWLQPGDVPGPNCDLCHVCPGGSNGL